MNYLIVDDEPEAGKLLQNYLANISNYHLIGICESAMEAYKAIHSQKVDLMFLDIKMPVISGTDFLRSLKDPPMVIFTTAYNKFAMEGFDLNVIDYLLKPISLPRLLQALEKVDGRKRIKEPIQLFRHIDHVFIKADNKLIKVNLHEILLVEAMQNYIKLHTKEKILIAAYTMKELEDMLPEDRFIRVHRSFIASKSTIEAINGNIIETSYRNLPIGVSYKNAVTLYADSR
jgi:DNA-binding LytR/AlgR family response regulator